MGDLMKLRLLRLKFGLLVGLALLASLPASGIAHFALPGVGSSAPNPPHAIGDWPMYGHDISRTNFNPDETTISAANVAQLVQRWQANIGTNGTGTSGAPSVSNGVVYVPSSAASPASNFFGFNAVSGAPVFSKNIGYRSSCFNVGIGSAPAISGTVAVIGADNAQSNPSYYGLSTVDASPIWTNTMGVGATGFPWESPLIYNGRAYVGMSSRCDNPSVRGEIRSVNYLDGSNPVSQYFVGPGQTGGGIWNSPAISPDGSTLVVASGEDFSCSPCTYTRSIVTLDPSTLAILQSNQQGNPNVDQDWGTTPLVFHDSQNRTLTGAQLKSSGFYAYLINSVSSGPLWTRSTGISVGMMAAYDPTFGNGGTLFVYGGSGTIYALDPATGNNSATDRWPPVTGASGAHGNMAVANGLIFLNLGSSGLQIRSEANGAVLRTIVPPNAGATNSGVAVSNGFVYWISGSYVNAWSLPAAQGTPTTTATAGAATATSTIAPSATATAILPTATATLTTVPASTATRTGTAVATATCVPVTSLQGVSAGDFFFVPQNITVTAGTTVRWTNVSTQGIPHTSSSDGGVWDSGTLNQGQQFDFTFNTPGTFPYHCEFHPEMIGSIVVQAGTLCATQTATRTNTPVAPSATRTSTSTVIVPTTLPTNTTGAIPTFTSTRTSTPPAPSATATPRPPTQTPGGPSATPEPPTSTLPPTSTGTATTAPSATSTACTVTFTDVDQTNVFYPFIRCLACRGIIGGYDDGTFRPFNDITRGQIAKIVSNAAGFQEDPGPQLYEDVPPGSPFYMWINRLSNRGHIGGYPCGLLPEEPCIEPGNMPYFRPSNSATRGQLAKIVSNAAGINTTPTGVFYTDVPEDHTFYLWIMRLTELNVMSGYDCGGEGEPCDDQNRPYFRPFNNVTRGQASKIVANTFFPGCQTPSAP
jgi:plastocyanin